MPLANLVTGGAGFIGSNLADRLLARGEAVTVLDNLSRLGSQRNLARLRTRHDRARLRVMQADVRDFATLASEASQVDRIFHLAGQVAVTTSIADPRGDFEANALGTLNVLEAARLSRRDPIVLYASTNKVYGDLEALGIHEEATRYSFDDRPHGVSEEQPLDFHSPYGCSKGAGDQYARDYHRIFGVRTVVFRQSCVFGPRQAGVEDQGWVAWFVTAALRHQPITVFGSGKQVRDLLFIEDLLDAYDAAVANIDRAAGEVYNIGGGPGRSVSIWHEFGPLLEKTLGLTVRTTRGRRRAGDQRVYISDIRKAARDLGWKPTVGVDDGVRRLAAGVETIPDPA